MNWLTFRSDRARRVIEGVPLVVVQDSRPVLEVLVDLLEHIPLEEVHEAARQEGIVDLDKVRLGVLEPSGRVSFFRAPDG